MSLDTHLTIINGTPYSLVRDREFSYHYQMNDWSFPDTILSGETARVLISYSQAVFHSSCDDEGKEKYGFADTSGQDKFSSFEIHATANINGYPQLLFDPSGLSNDGNKHPIDTPRWIADKELYILIAGDNSGYSTRIWWLWDEA